MKTARLMIFLLLAVLFLTSSLWIPRVSSNVVLNLLFVSPFGLCAMMLALVIAARATAKKPE